MSVDLELKRGFGLLLDFFWTSGVSSVYMTRIPCCSIHLMLIKIGEAFVNLPIETGKHVFSIVCSSFFARNVASSAKMMINNFNVNDNFLLLLPTKTTFLWNKRVPIDRQ